MKKVLAACMLLFVVILLTGCVFRQDFPVAPRTNYTHNSSQNSSQPKDVSSPIIPASNNITANTTVDASKDIETSSCPSEIHSVTKNVPGNSFNEDYIFRNGGSEYRFSSQQLETLHVSKQNLKTKDLESDIVIPTGIYAPKDAVLIDENVSVKFLNRTYERIDKFDSKEILYFVVYNLTSGCTRPHIETKPLMVLDCSAPSTGDCIGSRYDSFQFAVRVRNENNDPLITMQVNVDGGDTIIPANEVRDADYISQGYGLPAGILSDGRHRIDVKILKGGRTISEETYALIILPDDKVAFRKYQSVYVWFSSDEADFITYYDDKGDDLVVKQNYYSENYTIHEGGCSELHSRFSACLKGEEYDGLYTYKVLTLSGAKSMVLLPTHIFPDSCKTSKIVTVGGSFEDRYGDEYTLMKVYATPRMAAFKQKNHGWIVNYPYDKLFNQDEQVKMSYVTSDSVNVLQTDTFCALG